MLRVEGLSKRYGPLRALDDVGFTVERGQIVGFLGPNGAGKTTTMRAIMGLVDLDAGSVTWDGRPVDRPVRRRFGYMPAERGMYQKMKIREHLSYYGELSGISASRAARSADEWLERLGLTDRAQDEVQALSSGNQQRVQLALALMNEPDLLVLDEPFAGLDPVAVGTLTGVLEEQADRGAALLLSSHQLDLVADVCSSAVIIDGGEVVVDGEVATLRAASEVRHIDVEFAAPTRWMPPGIEAERIETGDGDRRHRVTVASGTDPGEVIAHAHRSGSVVSYAFAPPDLSEVFMALVGRTTVEAQTAGTEAGGTAPRPEGASPVEVTP